MRCSTIPKNRSLVSNRVLFRLQAGICASILFVCSTIAAGLAAISLENGSLSGPRGELTATTTIAEYRKDLKMFVQRSKSNDGPIRFGAVLNLCMLHHQLVNDSRFATNRQLQGFRAVAAGRLKKCQKEIELKLLRDRRANRGERTAAKTERRPTMPDSYHRGRSSSEFRFALYEKIIADDVGAMASIAGGPVNLWHYTGNPAGPLCDYGPGLVNLIESTISPEVWRRNGGNGSMSYYRPLRIIVVNGPMLLEF